MIEFLKIVMASFTDILAYDFITGISLQTIFFYNLLLISFFTVLAHRR